MNKNDLIADVSTETGLSKGDAASTSNTGGVLDGDLDEFMQAALAQKAFGGGPERVEDVE